MISFPRIAIIGAGPSGSTCSFFLSKHQIPHVLIDTADFPRDKICGDAISGKALHILRKMDPQIEDLGITMHDFRLPFQRKKLFDGLKPASHPSKVQCVLDHRWFPK